MRVAFAVSSLIFIAVSAPHATAQAPIATPPYEPVLVGAAPVPEANVLETFATIRMVVAAKDESRLGTLLAPDFRALSCSSDPTVACAPGTKSKAVAAKGSPLQRLRLTVCCEGRDDRSISPAARSEALFGVLDSLLQGGVPARAPDMPDTFCSPGIPTIDKAKARALATRLDIDPSTLRQAAAPIEARPRADRSVPVAATLPKGALVPLLTTSATPAPDGWTALALPGGGIGYAEGVTLDELAPESLCVRRTKNGWRLTALVGRQS